MNAPSLPSDGMLGPRVVCMAARKGGTLGSWLQGGLGSRQCGFLSRPALLPLGPWVTSPVENGGRDVDLIEGREAHCR